jgi:multidrug efflux pump subunit AcrB
MANIKENLKDRFFTAFNSGFDAMNNKYTGSLRRMAKNKWVTGIILFVFIGITYFLLPPHQAGLYRMKTVVTLWQTLPCRREPHWNKPKKR